MAQANPRKPSQAEQQAVEWLLRLLVIAQSPDPKAEWRKDQNEFNTWATRSAQNLRSWFRVYAMWLALGEGQDELMEALRIEPRKMI